MCGGVMAQRIIVFAQSLCVLLGILIHEGTGTGRVTPLRAKVYHNGSACIAENLRQSNKYTCDSIGHVICLPGWSEPEHLCETPICNIQGKSCVNGKCIFPNVCSCDIGWDGPSCDECIPLSGCLHGTCKGALECNCEPGWLGVQCNKAECNDCQNGCCHEPNKCICDPGWQGANCTQCETLPNCINGRCINNPFQCVCNPGWQGNGCSKPICRETCHPENGYCRRPGECICNHGWSGRDCTECVPYPGCNGTCVNNVPWTCSDPDSDGGEGRAGQWSAWSVWSACSKSCGDGVQKRDRTCGNGSSDRNCVGLGSETQKCAIANCRVDGGWALWTRWSLCSTSCGTGFKSRSRACSDPIPRYGGDSCPGSGTEKSKCFTTFCPIAGRWSSWQEWGQLSVTCGEGVRQRTRRCDSPAPAHGGISCLGESVITNIFTERECPVDAEWSNWSQWTACSKSCDRGQRSRVRNCGRPQFGGQPCPGNQTVERDVVDCWVQQVCAIDGQWSNWLQWSDCTATCGGGSRQRRRLCDSPIPKFGGRRCLGNEYDTQTCQTDACPVDGKWSQWRQWSQCTKTCGSGTQNRKRVCENPRFGGKACTGPTTDNRQCNTQNCPIDGSWGLWGRWGTCSASCNGGTQSRKRTCTSPKFGGQPCIGNGVENKACNEESCAVDGKWTAWRQWTSCTRSCRGGTQTRERACDEPQFGGMPCDGQVRQSQDCNARVECAVDGKWALWGQWGRCSASCDGGMQSRDRKCIPPKFGGDPCEGRSQETKSCNQNINCPIDGVWAQWLQWSSCSSSCNGGFRHRDRRCIDPQFNGRPCTGASQQSEHCNNEINCPIHGEWGEWGFWSACSSTCAGGEEKRRRPCIDPKHGGLPCNGKEEESRTCNANVQCAVDGKWAQWGFWSSCTSSCIGGTFNRKRNCINPRNGGLPCTGRAEEVNACNLNVPCAIDGIWTHWGFWSLCTSTCNGGTQKRTRECDNPQNGGEPCTGAREENQSCNTDISCSVDGTWAQWGFWSSCTSTCAGGAQTRKRDCNEPLHGGLPCHGAREESQACNSRISCAIDGEWAQWEFWSSCTSTCAGGTQTRRRDCHRPFNGGMPCNGAREENQACNSQISCAVDGMWAQWGFWSSCTSTCAGGTQSRRRDCQYSQNGGLPCHGAREENQACNSEISCQVDGTWAQWEFWSSCSSTCAGGTQTRRRDCNHPHNGGLPCLGAREENQACNSELSCAVDGLWAQWEFWSSCTSTCAGGTQTRRRDCNHPHNGGLPCLGAREENQACNSEISCAVDGTWAQWGFWSSCTSTCAGGTQIRSRDCQIPQNGGLHCHGAREENQACNSHISCSVDGVWSQWSYWSACSSTCSGGFHDRERTCNNLTSGGRPCEGLRKETQPCNQNINCVVHGEWSQWGFWSSCSTSCERGTRSRRRDCDQIDPNGFPCVGRAEEVHSCNVDVQCPVDGQWAQWSHWGSCSVSCGGGVQHRDRSCKTPRFGGVFCTGQSHESQSCGQDACFSFGFWSEWTYWSSCSVSCGDGSRSRHRSCDHGDHCEGSAFEESHCNDGSCIPVGGIWGQWSFWSSCSVSCGHGNRVRYRNCDSATIGQPCQGESIESDPCFEGQCGIDGQWGQWGPWGFCSVTCGVGARIRDRKCDSPAPQNGGQHCIGENWENGVCDKGVCSTIIDGNWGVWGTWSSCSQSCGNGTQTRRRNCNNPQPSGGGSFCDGPQDETHTCLQSYCAIDGGFSEWTAWSPCTAKCLGDRGDRVRRRFCNNPRPKHGGRRCEGDIKEKELCTGTIPKQENDPTNICFNIGEK